MPSSRMPTNPPQVITVTGMVWLRPLVFDSTQRYRNLTHTVTPTLHRPSAYIHTGPTKTGMSVRLNLILQGSIFFLPCFLPWYSFSLSPIHKLRDFFHFVHPWCQSFEMQVNLLNLSWMFLCSLHFPKQFCILLLLEAWKCLSIHSNHKTAAGMWLSLAKKS